MACSLASRIVCYEAGAELQFIEVDARDKRTERGDDYWQITPMGQVPALRTDDGVLISENAAVLQFLGERYPAAALLPDEGLARAQLRQWLGANKALFAA
jgi:glutathione S-transferase